MSSTILGIIASSAGGVATSYESIATVTVGSGGSATVSFTSIPSTYTHLQIRFIAKTTNTSSGEDNITFNFNSDTTQTNYRSHWVYGDGSTAIAGQIQGSGYYLYPGSVSRNSASETSMYGAGIIDILDYANTNKNKVSRSLMGNNTNATYGTIRLNSGLWLSTSAITGITFRLLDANNFAQYSSFALYGIKGL